MFQASVKKNNIVEWKMKSDGVFRSKFERIPSQLNSATGRSRIFGESLAPTGTDFD